MLRFHLAIHSSARSEVLQMDHRRGTGGHRRDWIVGIAIDGHSSFLLLSIFVLSPSINTLFGRWVHHPRWVQQGVVAAIPFLVYLWMFGMMCGNSSVETRSIEMPPSVPFPFVALMNTV